MSEFKVYKSIGSVPQPYTPNAIYFVRVGKGFDLYCSDVTGNILHKINSNESDIDADKIKTELEEFTKLYVQSRGTGIISNGSGLMGTNYNFSKFSIVKDDVPDGKLSFKSTLRNADFAIDELIPVFGRSYRVSFSAKYGEDSTFNGKTYFYVAPYDIDGHPMNPVNWCDTVVVTQDQIYKGQNSFVIDPAYREAFRIRWEQIKNATIPFRFHSYEYTSPSGKKYPDGTYSRAQYSEQGITKNCTYDPDTGVFSGITFLVDIAPGYKMSFGLAGASYAYPEPQLLDKELNTEWTTYHISFSPSNILPLSPNAIHNKLFQEANYIKIGWLMNRGQQEGSTTLINNVSME